MNQGGVFVSSEQIYDEVLGVKEGLARVQSLLEKHVALEEQRNAGIELRLENHGTRLGDQGTQIANLETRVTNNENDIRVIKEADTKKESRKATWPQVITAVVACVTGAGALVGLFVTLNSIAQAIGAA